MLARRGLLGLFAAAPVIIAADRLMPVRSPRSLRPFTMADLEFVEREFDHGYFHGVGAQFRMNGAVYRHAVAISTASNVPPSDHDRDQAKRAILRWANEIRLAA